MLIVICGLPGSGKSYFASRLAERIHAVYLSSDVLRKKLFAKPGYSREEKEKVYDMLLAEARKNLKNGNDVILDATFYESTQREKVRETACADNSEIFWIKIFAQEQIIRERLKKERKESDADDAVYQKLKASFEPLRGRHLELESDNHNIEEMLKQALQYIEYGKS